MRKVKIIYTFTQNLGERFDDEENFCGHKTITTLEEDIVDECQVAQKLNTINNTSADFGDGITSAHVLAVVNMENKQILPKNYEYWKWEDET